MTRKVFFSFKYDDVHRAMNVRNSNVIGGVMKSGFIDKAEFERSNARVTELSKPGSTIN